MLDNVECMFDILCSENEEDNLLDIGVKVESSNSLEEILLFGCIDPRDHESRCIGDIVDHDRYEGADHDAPEEEDDEIYSDNCEPAGYLMYLALIYERIYDDRDKS